MANDQSKRGDIPVTLVNVNPCPKRVSEMLTPVAETPQEKHLGHTN